MEAVVKLERWVSRTELDPALNNVLDDGVTPAPVVANVDGGYVSNDSESKVPAVDAKLFAHI